MSNTCPGGAEKFFLMGRNLRNQIHGGRPSVLTSWGERRAEEEKRAINLYTSLMFLNRNGLQYSFLFHFLSPSLESSLAEPDGSIEEHRGR